MPPFEGRSGDQRFLHGLIDRGMTAVEFTPVDTKDAGALVIEYGRYEIQLPGDGGTDLGKYIVVREGQSDGSLKIVFDIFNSDGPAAP